MAIQPMVNAILACRDVRDNGLQGITLTDVVNALYFDSFPARLDKLLVFIAMTNMHGEVQFDFVVSLAGVDLVRKKLPMSPPKGPLDYNAGIVNLSGVALPSTGSLTIDLFFEGNPVIGTSVAVETTETLRRFCG